MHRTHTCGELRADHAGQTVTLSGWIQRTRDLGGMTFVDVRDRYGLTQLAFNMDSNEALCLSARKLGREFVIKATGLVKIRESKNAQMPTGDIEIEVTQLDVLNASKTPPFTIEDDTDGGDDLRMQFRYLDLRRLRSAACGLLVDVVRHRRTARVLLFLLLHLRKECRGPRSGRSAHAFTMLTFRRACASPFLGRSEPRRWWMSTRMP